MNVSITNKKFLSLTFKTSTEITPITSLQNTHKYFAEVSVV